MFELIALAATFVGNLLIGWLAGRPRPGIRLDTRSGVAAYVAGGRGGFVSMHAVIYIHAIGRASFTLREVGWVAGDGEERECRLGADRTARPGGPELRAPISVSTLRKLMHEHRGLSHVYVLLVGDKERRRIRVTNEWRVQINEASAKNKGLG